MNNYFIRDMSLEEVEEVAEIEQLSFKIPWSKEAFVMELEKNKCAKYRVVLKENRVAAYGGFWMVVDEAHITNIAVHPAFRGQGFGNVIVEDMILLARSLKIIAMTLEVRVSNIPAIKLYSKYGFCEVGRRRGYYTDTQEDAIIMWRHEI